MGQLLMRQSKCPIEIVCSALLAILTVLPYVAPAQSPELAMRDFSSGQIKKGVRTIGLGGDGATWGNYALVWKDADTGLVDYGDTTYTNGNDFHFEAVGLTSPSLWHDLTIYVIAMSEGTNNVTFKAKSPGLGPDPVPVAGDGSDHAVFTNRALTKCWHAGHVNSCTAAGDPRHACSAATWPVMPGSRDCYLPGCPRWCGSTSVDRVPASGSKPPSATPYPKPGHRAPVVRGSWPNSQSA